MRFSEGEVHSNVLTANSFFTPAFFNTIFPGGEKIMENEKTFSSEFSLYFLQYSLSSIWFNKHKTILFKKISLEKSHETILPILQCILFYLNLMNFMSLQDNLRAAVSEEYFYKSGSLLRTGLWGKGDFHGDSGVWIWRQPFFRVTWKLSVLKDSVT